MQLVLLLAGWLREKAHSCAAQSVYTPTPYPTRVRKVPSGTMTFHVLYLIRSCERGSRVGATQW